MKKRLGIFFALLCVIFSQFAMAQVEVKFDFQSQLAAWDRTADQAEELLESDDPPDIQLSNMRKALSSNRAKAQDFVELRQQDIAPLQNQLKALEPTNANAAGSAGDDGGGSADSGAEEADKVETQDLQSRRKAVEDQLANVEAEVAAANQTIQQANALIVKIDQQVRTNYYNALLTRSKSPLNTESLRYGAAVALSTYQSISGEIQTNFAAIRGSGVISERWPTSVLIIAFGLFIGFFARWLVRVNEATDSWPTKPQRILIPLAPTFAGLMAWPVSVYFVAEGLKFSQLFGYDGEALIDSCVVIGYFVSAAGWLKWSLRSDKVDSYVRGEHLGRYFYIIAFTAGVSWSLQSFTRIADLPPEAATTAHFLLLLIGTIYIWKITAINNFADLFGVTQLTTSHRLKLAFRGFIRWGAIIALLLSLIGYFAMSYQLYHGLVFSAFVIVAAIHVYRMIYQLILRILYEAKLINDEQRADTEDKLWPILLQLGVFLAAIPLIAASWGVPFSAIEEVWTRLRGGLRLGEIQISFTGVIKLIIFLYLGILIVQGLKRVLDRQILTRTKLDIGARSAIVALFGYMAYTLAALMAMSFAGLDVSSLAYIAGALSVGIGFGLQNIVQNFVSGIILLIERPIKKGDWVKVSDSEGYVHKIAVRSTEIKTFDDSTIIVPNADLITNAVTNWFHDDQSARVVVPVSVSYDADPDYIEQVLLELVDESTYKRRNPNASVVIRSFADSGVDYELRYWIKDADWITRARSETFMAILRRFRKEGIVIPYPQREIRMLEGDPSQD